MTTPDKEEMPTADRIAGPRWVQSPHHPRVLYDSASNGGIIECDSPEVAAYIATACNAYEPMREALLASREAIASLDKPVLGYETAGDGSAYWPVQSVLLNQIDAALSTLPVNDRHHSGSDSYQADASAPALSEKVAQGKK